MALEFLPVFDGSHGTVLSNAISKCQSLQFGVHFRNAMYTSCRYLSDVWPNDRAANNGVTRTATAFDFHDAGFRKYARRLWFADGDQEKTVEYASDLVS